MPANQQQIALTGTAFVLGAAGLWGTTGVVAKLIYNLQVPPTLLAAARINVAFWCLSLFLALFRPRLLYVPVRQIPHLIVFGIIGLGLCQYSYLYTMTQASVGVAVLLQSTAPALIYIYTLLTKQEPPTLVKTAALLIAMSGGAVVVLGGGGWGGSITPAGLFSGTISAACLAFYSLRAKPWLRTYSPWTILVWGLGSASLAWWFFQPPWVFLTALVKQPNLGLAVLYLAVFTTAIPFGLYLNGVARLMPSTAGILGTAEPVAAAALAFAVLGENLSPLQVGGGVLVLSAVALLNMSLVRPNRTVTPTTQPH